MLSLVDDFSNSGRENSLSLAVIDVGALSNLDFDFATSCSADFDTTFLADFEVSTLDLTDFEVDTLDLADFEVDTLDLADFDVDTLDLADFVVNIEGDSEGDSEGEDGILGEGESETEELADDPDPPILRTSEHNNGTKYPLYIVQFSY